MPPCTKLSSSGDGGWGTALALVLARSGCKVGLWSHDAEYADVMRAERTNPRFLPGLAIPQEIEIASSFADLLDDADLLLSAVPTAFLRSVWAPHARWLPSGLPILTVSKGLERETLMRPSEILAEVGGPNRPLAVLSGPNIAREVAKALPSATVVSSSDASLARRIQATFRDPAFRVYVNDDPVGVELGGVLKNVIALAAGMCDGLELGANAKSALVTRGVLEMARLGMAFGGQQPTYFGLSGLGDLITTCTVAQQPQSHLWRAHRSRRTRGGYRGEHASGGRRREERTPCPSPQRAARPGAAHLHRGLSRDPRGTITPRERPRAHGAHTAQRD